MRKDLESLIEQALDNIKNDRQLTEILLSELQNIWQSLETKTGIQICFYRREVC